MLCFDRKTIDAAFVRLHEHLREYNSNHNMEAPDPGEVRDQIATVFGYSDWQHLHDTIYTPACQAGTWVAPNEHINFDPNPQHCLLQGPDEQRRDLYQQIFEQNPHRSTVFIQGSLSVPLAQWRGNCLSHFEEIVNLSDRSIDYNRISPTILIDLFSRFLDIENNPEHLKALELITCVVFALTYSHENDGLRGAITDIRTNITFDNVCKLARRRDLPTKLLRSIRDYLESLPEFDKSWHSNASSINARAHHARIEKSCDFLKYFSGYYFYPSHQIPDSRTRIVYEEFKDQGYTPLLGPYLDHWSETNPTGLIVVDGVAPNSPLYDFILMRLSRYKQQRVGVLLGYTSVHDFPRLQLFEQMRERIGDPVVLNI